MHLDRFRGARISLIILACALSSASGTAAAQDERPNPAQRVCPMDIPGTSVFALQLDENAGLAFVTTGDVGELQHRVRALAALQNRAAAAGAAVATVESIEHGAILSFFKGPGGGTDELQRDVFAYAEQLAGGDCPMVRDQAAVVPDPKKSAPIPPEAPPPQTTVPGVHSGFTVPSIVSMPPVGVGF